MISESELEALSLLLLSQMVTNPTTTHALEEDKIVEKAWKYAELYMAERTKRREVAEAMKELDE